MPSGIDTERCDAAILFADVCGSVRLYERLGDDQALARISQYLAFLTEVIAEFSGQVVKTIGDELMCVFPDAEHCARGSIAVLERLQRWPLHQQDPICFKVGMHCGEVIRKDGDIFGDAVNLAARMVSLANENQLILTVMMLEQLPAELQQQCRLVGPIYVKGKQQPIAVHELLWNVGDSADATMVGPSKDLPVVKRRLLLSLGGQECIVDEQHPSASIGRAADSDLVTLGSLVSRHHLVIEQRGDSFIATDKSTNATFVGGPQDQQGQRLHRDKLSLSGRGWLSLGEAHPEEDQKIHFEIL